MLEDFWKLDNVSWKVTSFALRALAIISSPRVFNGAKLFRVGALF
jgi:hypothetical protein